MRCLAHASVVRHPRYATRGLTMQRRWPLAEPHVASTNTHRGAVMYRVKIVKSASSVVARSLERRRGRDDLVLLLHELFSRGFDGNCQAEFG